MAIKASQVSNWYVHYTIQFPGQEAQQHKAGPYHSIEEVNYQRDDIAGYEHVSNAHVVEGSDG